MKNERRENRMKNYFPEGKLLETVENKKTVCSPSALSEAAAREELLEGRAMLCDSQHNLVVDLGCMQGIIPREEGAIGIAEGSVKDIALISRVGKAVCFQVKSVRSDTSGRFYAMLSRRSAQERCRDEYIKRLVPGDIIDARITHLESFGAFCDIGCGIISLLPIDSISVSRISHPADRFCVGDDIKAVVRAVDSWGRITLSHKELLGTWEENAGLFSAGETVQGIVRSVEDYGIFIELTPNLAGLAEYKEGIYAGQQASVYIKNLIPDKMKVKLIVIDSFDAPSSRRDTKYFLQRNHIDRWRYSPDSSERLIESIF